MEGSKAAPPAGGKGGTIALVILTVIGIVVVAALLLLPFSSPAIEREVGGISEHLMGGSASDHILDVQDMGRGWEGTDVLTDVDQVMGSSLPEGISNVAECRFYQNSSEAVPCYIVDVTVSFFHSTDDASLYYVYASATNASPDTSPVLLCNTTFGDEGVILDAPHATLGHEAKSLLFRDRNVVCQIDYHHAGTYETLPNSLLEELAGKLEAKL